MNGVRKMSMDELEAAFARADEQGCIAVKRMLIREVIRRTTECLRAA